jgi:hypothetical protein
MTEVTHMVEEQKPGETTFVQVEAFPELVKELASAPPCKRHNVARINKLLARYGLSIDDKMESVKIKSLWRYLSAGAWKGKK